MKPDVLIIGAGPVGLTMAAELARYGVSVRIIDKSPARTDRSKALVVWSRTLELMDRMGCTAAFVKAGLQVHAANIIAGTKLLAHVELGDVKTPYPFALMIPQSETERLMEDHLNTLGVQVERTVELTQFTSVADHVNATLKNASGKEESLDVKWLIGCDGAHSTVRHSLGLKFEGETLPSKWILADVHLAGVKTKADELSIYWHAEGTLVTFPISPGRYRVIADFDESSPDAPRSDPTLAEVQSVIDKRGPSGITAADPIWLASFTINERKVADYRVGRVFLAGDAAHVHSPAGGQGMNTGMQDAINLAWKLALVHHGHAAAEPLLESYSIERSAVGRQVLADAGRLTVAATLKGGVAQSIRNHIASLVFGLSSIRGVMADKLTELSIGYPHSPLTGPGHHAGSRAPVTDTQNAVGAGSEPRFALFTNASPDAAALIARHPDLLESRTREPFSKDGICLVRPDGYIAMTAREGEWTAVDNYLARVVGPSN